MSMYIRQPFHGSAFKNRQRCAHYIFPVNLMEHGAEDMERRTRDGRTFVRRDRRDIEERLDRLEERVERLERPPEEQVVSPEGANGCSCCDDLIGCLDDCVEDVRELRKRVKDVRS